MKILKLLFLAILVVGCSPNKIITDRNLQWSDFKGKPDKFSTFEAYTSYKLQYSYEAEFNNGRAFIVNLKIQPLFRTKLSWAKVKTDHLLNHEQGHYSLIIASAKELRRRIYSTAFYRYNYEYEIERIYKEVWDKYAALQQQYDKETRHSLNKEKQAEWDRKIKYLNYQ